MCFHVLGAAGNVGKNYPRKDKESEKMAGQFSLVKVLVKSWHARLRKHDDLKGKKT